MTIDPALLAFVAVVFAGYAVQTITGFGSTLLCVTFGALFLDIRTIVTLAVPISLLQTAYIAIRHHHDVRWRMLLVRILPLMGIGLGVGLLAVTELGQGAWLKPLFGVLTFLLASRELVLIYRRRHDAEGTPLTPLHPAAAYTSLFGAGILHGIFATGGPLLVYAISKEELTKGEVRSTLSIVWLVLNVALLAAFLLEGRYDAPMVTSLGVVLPGVGLGVLVGEWLHHRVDERRFRTSVFGLLLAASIALIVRA